MTTLTRLQAFYWSVKLGSLDAAAARLHVTSSAVGKRLRELQLESRDPLFDPVRKGLKLTDRGHELMPLAEAMVIEAANLEELKKSPFSGARSISVGLTELTVVTWFRTFITRLKSMYPDIVVIPHVGLSASIRQLLEAGYLDFAILQEAYVSAEMASLRLGSAHFDWICKPGLVPTNQALSLEELSNYPIIDQGPDSGLSTLVRKLLANRGLGTIRESGSNSLVALAALLEAGLGVSCMPQVLVHRSIQAGRLQRIRTTPLAPTVEYYAVFLPHDNPLIGWKLAALAKECCSFDQLA